jgi:hypothetical protein
MNTEQKQILLRKKGKKSSSGLADSSDSLLDLLCNVVGVLVLVSSLAGVFAATSAVNIQAPMKKETKKQFWTLQAAKEGVWDIQPAINRMAELDRERAKEVRNCMNLLSPELEICNNKLDGWKKEEQINGISMTISHEKGQIIRSQEPTINSESEELKDWLDKLMKKLNTNNQAVFIVLEASGYKMYREIKRAAQKNKVPIGWEPWYKDDPINFWGNSGRSMTIQ